jgi:hypothetical protein
MAKPITKKQSTNFFKQVSSLLENAGWKLSSVHEGSDLTAKMHRFEYKTNKYGTVEVSIFDDNCYIYSCYVRFCDNDKLFDARIDVNEVFGKFNGLGTTSCKWNTHQGDPKSAINEIVKKIEFLKGK